MKTLYLLLLSFICLSSLTAFAQDDCCKKQMTPAAPCEKQVQKPCETPCPQTSVTPCPDECFLCTNCKMNTLFRCMNLSSSQICNAHKIQEKYNQEVLSLNERLQCEKQKLCQLEKSCAKSSEIRKQKRLIKKLEKTKKEICKCYEQQFKATLSSQQIKAYNKNKKS